MTINETASSVRPVDNFIFELKCQFTNKVSLKLIKISVVLVSEKNPEYYTISFYSCECQTLASKSATAENKLFEAERRVEALATLQSHRWMEFSKMADNMKELSHSMLTQSKSNTRKAAIRADLDEELEM